MLGNEVQIMPSDTSGLATEIKAIRADNAFATIAQVIEALFETLAVMQIVTFVASKVGINSDLTMYVGGAVGLLFSYGLQRQFAANIETLVRTGKSTYKWSIFAVAVVIVVLNIAGSVATANRYTYKAELKDVTKVHDNAVKQQNNAATTLQQGYDLTASYDKQMEAINRKWDAFTATASKAYLGWYETQRAKELAKVQAAKAKATEAAQAIHSSTLTAATASETATETAIKQQNSTELAKQQSQEGWAWVVGICLSLTLVGLSGFFRYRAESNKKAHGVSHRVEFYNTEHRGVLATWVAVVAANWNRWAIDKALQKAPKTAVKQQNSTTTRPVNMQGEQTHPSTSNGFIPDFTRFKTDIRNAFSRSINSVSQETKDSNRKTFERLKQVAEDAGYNVTTWVADVRTPATRKIKGKIKVVQEFDVQITLTKSQTA